MTAPTPEAVAHVFLTEAFLNERVVTGRGGERALFLPEATRLARVSLEQLAAAGYTLVRNVAGGRCQNCDGTGDVHSPDGEWRGVCHCVAAAEAGGQHG